ncbi:hypothetical protein VTN77DRAFT_5127 [Rasamsonia byssochlamydoides]|uniref:uncharacterized protein n=1 Tax=Rasamsonia byssochlamydoides TaxID=89139 RepID=UPI00374474F4
MAQASLRLSTSAILREKSKLLRSAAKTYSCQWSTPVEKITKSSSPGSGSIRARGQWIFPAGRPLEHLDRSFGYLQSYQTIRKRRIVLVLRPVRRTPPRWLAEKQQHRLSGDRGNRFPTREKLE